MTKKQKKTPTYSLIKKKMAKRERERGKKKRMKGKTEEERYEVTSV